MEVEAETGETPENSSCLDEDSKGCSPSDDTQVTSDHPNGVPNINGTTDTNDANNMDGSKQDEPWNQNTPGNNFQSKPFNPNYSFRGRGGLGGMPPFNRGRNPNADVSWQNPNTPQPHVNGPQFELWVETKTEDGKSYFYHALTRETTWNKPEGPNIKIMTQAEIEEKQHMMQQQQQQQTPHNSNAGTATKTSDPTSDTVEQSKEPSTAMKKQEILTTQPPPNMLSQPPPNLANSGPPPMNQQGPPAMHQQTPPFYPPGMHQPNFSQPPFGMPPPGYGGYPGQVTPWGMPWNQQMHVPPSQHEKPAKNLIIKPGVIDPAVIARAAEWSEHRAPDGRPYYYHAGRGESVWEKPQALRDMEAARMAAHSGATPQQAAAHAGPTSMPHLMTNPLMHMPPNVAAFDPSIAYNAAAAVAVTTSKINENVKPQVEKEKKLAEEKRKKDEEQKKATGSAPAKPVDKSRPISSTPIAGTPWCVVWTGDFRVFFYNPSTRTSVWERPEELLDREDVDKAVATAPEQLKNSAQAASDKSEEKETEKPKQAIVVEEEDNRDEEVIKIRTESESSVEEVPTKKTKLITKSSKKSDANEAAVEAEVRAAKERALVPLETRIKQFKEMLREKDVSAFSTWEKELHKIVFDPRYLLLTSKERKQVFEKYVKDRAEEERKEKRNKMRQKRDDFRKLMEDAKLHGKSSFSDFCQRFGKDERYRAIEKIRERESLFNEYIVDVRRQEKEDKILKKEQIRKEFLEMLRERSDIDRHTRWHDIKKKFDTDSRYRAVESSSYREEYFQDYLRIVKDEKRKQREQREREKEREREKGRDRERRKSDRKDKGRDRDRSRSRSHNKDRNGGEKDKDKDTSLTDKDKSKEKEKERERESEKNGDKTIGTPENDVDEVEGDGHAASEEEDEMDRLRKERERQLRAELSIREREKEVQRTLAGHLRDRDKEREHHKRDEAIGHFNALLIDLVRNPDLTWKEVKRQLRKDHRWDLIESLDRDDREKIFNDHIDGLMKKKREKFREMLDEIQTLELVSSWKDIKKLIKEDPRYLKYNNSEKCEREFRDYIKDKTLSAKSALRELLQECKLITYKSIELVKENPNHLKEIQDILKNDKRYLILDHISEERTTIILNYLEELYKRGPPPPPTASESTRRNK